MEIKIMVYVALIEGGRFNTHDALCFSTADGREEYIDNHEWHDADIQYLEREMIVKIQEYENRKENDGGFIFRWGSNQHSDMAFSMGNG